MEKNLVFFFIYYFNLFFVTKCIWINYKQIKDLDENNHKARRKYVNAFIIWEKEQLF
jgi:hypothetical protein